MSQVRHQIVQPPAWRRPRGYSNGMVARGRQVFISGQIGWDAEERFVSDRLADQVRQSLANVLTVLQEAGGKPEDIVRLTWYVTDVAAYRAELSEIGAAYRGVMGKHFPTMSVVQVVSLVEAQAKVEIEATAVLPDT
jgi:enamine deaminase RidA (YjgF/YER057c/UK114 family)